MQLLIKVEEARINQNKFRKPKVDYLFKNSLNFTYINRFK